MQEEGAGLEKKLDRENETLYLLWEVCRSPEQKEIASMKDLGALILSTELTWRTNLLKPLAEQDAQTQAWCEAQGVKKRGRPKKNDQPPAGVGAVGRLPGLWDPIRDSGSLLEVGVDGKSVWRQVPVRASPAAGVGPRWPGVAGVIGCGASARVA